MSVRSRYTEDRLAQQVADGVMQYVILGAGLDTFAYRNSYAALRVFEVDFPATQSWKHELLADAGIDIPENLTFIPLDLEHKSLAESLLDAGFDPIEPAFFGWLGVVPYLTLDAFRATIATIGRLPVGTAVSFDYAFPPETLSPKRRKVFDTLSKRVEASGEPLQLFFTPEQLEKEVRAAGFSRVEQFDTDCMNEAYLKDRADGLKLSPVRVGMLATAWV
jgi:methyltransferase (TIGR00027 family)